MQQLSIYVSDEDAAILAAVGNKEGLSTSAVVRRGIRAMCDATPATIKKNAATALQEAREDAETLNVADLERSPWAGASE